MTAKHYSSAAGLYIGAFDGADVELPEGAVETTGAPKSILDVWVGGAWTRSLLQQKDEMQDALAAKRFVVEYGGFTPDSGALSGIFIDTTEKTRAVIDTAHRRATSDTNYTIRKFKSGRGAFAQMDAATIIAVGDAIEEFIQQCFEHESDVNDLIMAATTEAELDAIDIDAGWP